MKETLQVPYSTGRKPPDFSIPPKACDTHFHIFDPIHFPYKETDVRNQPPADVECYRLFMRRMGIERCVIVTPSCYGFDNSCTISALRQFGGCARAVVVINDEISFDTLKSWNEFGVRGIRFNVVSGSEDTLTHALRLSETVGKLGWHTDFYMSADMIVKLERTLSDYPTTVVIDHLGSLPPDMGIQHEAYAFLLELIRQKRAYVKASGFYLDSLQPDFSDHIFSARTYINEAPEGILWGSDWPHHGCWFRQKPMPDDAKMADSLFSDIDSDLCQRILADNPAKLYGFDVTENL